MSENIADTEADRNRAAVTAAVEGVFSHGDVELMDQIYDPGYEEWFPYGEKLDGREAIKGLMLGVRAVAPDYTETVDQIVVEGSKAACYFTGRGHVTDGSFYGVAPEGQEFELRHCSMFDLTSDGRLRRQWCEASLLEMLARLGAIDITHLPSDPLDPDSERATLSTAFARS